MTTKATKTKLTARIFQEADGYYYVCDDALDYLDCRGCGYRSKAAALRGAYAAGYTHAIGSGAYKQGGSIPSQVAITDTERLDHARSLADCR